jgi:hypothetical protein
MKPDAEKSSFREQPKVELSRPNARTVSKNANCDDNTALSLQFLQSWNQQPLGKAYFGDGRVNGAPRCTYYRKVATEHFSSPQALFERLTEASEERDLAPMTAALTISGAEAMLHGLALEKAGKLPNTPQGHLGLGVRRKFIAADGYEHPHLVAQASPVLFVDIDEILVDAADETWRHDLAGFAVSAIAKFLPSVFQNVSCWVSLSSSAGMNRTATGDLLIGLHLVFVANQALNGELRQQLVLMNNPDVDPSFGKVDVSPLRCTQLFYIAAPDFLEGAVDPVINRSTILSAQQNFVNVPISELKAFHKACPKGDLGRRADGLVPTEPGFRGYLSHLGDGVGRGGFHAPLRSAIASLAASVGQDVDWSAVKEELRNAIDGAPKSSGRDRDIERYKSDAYLDASFRGALTKFASSSMAHRRYAIPEGSLEEAEQKAGSFVSAFFSSLRTPRG